MADNRLARAFQGYLIGAVAIAALSLFSLFVATEGVIASTGSAMRQTHSLNIPEILTNTPTSTPVPTALVNGHLIWEGIDQTGSRNSLVTGTLIICNGNLIVYSNANLHTSESGYFSVFPSIPDGTYNWRLKGIRHLGNGGTLTISGRNSFTQVGTERAGDANNDSAVNVTDFNILKNNFGLIGSNRLSDFNWDAVTNSTDFNLLKSNFGQSGMVPDCLQAPGP